MADYRPLVQVPLEEACPQERVAGEGVQVAAGLGESAEGGHVQEGEYLEVNANLCVCELCGRGELYMCVCDRACVN